MENEKLVQQIFLSDITGKNTDIKKLKLIEDGKAHLYMFRDDSFEGRFRGFAEIFRSFLEKSDAGKKLSMNHKLFVMFHTLSSIMEYLINSSSFRTGKLQKFDLIELKRKIKMIISL